VLGFLDAVIEIALGAFIVYMIEDLRRHLPVSPLHMGLIPLFIFIKTAACVHSSHFINEFIPKRRTIKLRKTSG
jgi:hypothetical protein